MSNYDLKIVKYKTVYCIELGISMFGSIMYVCSVFLFVCLFACMRVFACMYVCIDKREVSGVSGQLTIRILTIEQQGPILKSHSTQSRVFNWTKSMAEREENFCENKWVKT